MPLYEYQCDVCGHRFEVIRKFSDAPLEQCPKCGASVRKLQSAPAFQFKGTGWYVTDYAKKEAAPAGKGDDAAPAGKDASSGKDAAPSKDTASSEGGKSGGGESSGTKAPAAEATPTAATKKST